jgi:hypothetical protein
MKDVATPQSAVIKLQRNTAIAMIQTRLNRSAKRAIGMPSMVYRMAKAGPPRRPICQSSTPKDALIGSVRMLMIDRSMKLKT